MSNHAQPDISTDLLIAAYRAGDSLRTIGKRYGLSHTAVNDRIAAAGEERRSTGPRHTMRICPCGVSFRPKWPGQVRCSEDCRPATHALLCKRGLHPMVPENLTPRYGHAGPRCRACMYLTQAEYRARQKGK